MRLDTNLELDVEEELHSDPDVEDAEIAVRVTGGLVRLHGSAPTMLAKLAAIRAAERVAGVRAVLDDLAVVPPPLLRRTDLEIARAVGLALELNVQVPCDRIRSSVSNGWVTLEGTVARQADRSAAEATVALLAGVRGIVNHIQLVPCPADLDSGLVERIDRALRRSAELDSKHVLVEASPEGEVLLRGMVHSWAERRDAERAAWSTCGVRSVTNRLNVVL